LAILPSMKRLTGKTLQEYEQRSSVIKAIAHPTRLFILDLLREGTLCVCEINDLIDADVSTISKHLSLLKNAGLVSSQKSGLQVHYRLEMPCVLDALTCINNKK
jgi:DNA-binding transcriptional ArsR family regulator